MLRHQQHTPHTYSGLPQYNTLHTNINNLTFVIHTRMYVHTDRQTDIHTLLFF